MKAWRAPSSKFERSFQGAGFRRIAGLDEAGRGPLAGPLVCAAVILKKRLKLPGLNDSKLLSARKREELYKAITDFCDYGVGVVSSKIIDSKGLIKACELGFRKAVSKLRQKPDLLLIDGCDHFIFPASKAHPSLGRPDYGLPRSVFALGPWPRCYIPHKSFIRGDRRIRSIAAASVVAKVYRDSLMLFYQTRFPNYEFQRHKGYGTRLHIKLLRQFGPSPIHRQSFKPLLSLRGVRSERATKQSIVKRLLRPSGSQ